MAENVEVVAEYILRDMADGEFWLDVHVNREPYCSLGPFDTETDRRRTLDDLLTMARSLGARDVGTG